jgi:hypothetical protein
MCWFIVSSLFRQGVHDQREKIRKVPKIRWITSFLCLVLYLQRFQEFSRRLRAFIYQAFRVQSLSLEFGGSGEFLRGSAHQIVDTHTSQKGSGMEYSQASYPLPFRVTPHLPHHTNLSHFFFTALLSLSLSLSLLCRRSAMSCLHCSSSPPAKTSSAMEEGRL